MIEVGLLLLQHLGVIQMKDLQYYIHVNIHTAGAYVIIWQYTADTSCSVFIIHNGLRLVLLGSNTTYVLSLLYFELVQIALGILELHSHHAT